ncbi:hypothetical protein [Bowmanella yangjiangensis]|uniref:Uncharacterized protein n=1 Tax=Bowmanella yangjiangensis TaxID=2811230 RepID=A0ABS3CN08_9ALTE|nr:hypothetical protein [Bowmanella yangjiangensis]MBN7818493.1 hypothetical protein [Bowmanella yangjiangensis]
MPISCIAKALLVWVAILLLAITNGIFREAVLLSLFIKSAAFMLSGLLLCLCIFVVTYLTLPWLGRGSPRRYWAVGMFWLVLTLCFEFVLGYIIQGHSWQQLLEPYTFKDGNLWPIVLLVTLASPYLAARAKKWL